MPTVATRAGMMAVVGVLAAGCAMTPQAPSCPQGQQPHDGQCVPTSSLVFERCLDSFRKVREQRQHGVDTEVTAQVRGQGGTFHRERQDTEHAEYDGLPDALMDEAIDECRRQEQQQRTLELERAWAAVEAADQRAQRAEAQTSEAQRAQMEAQAHAREQAEVADTLRATVLATEQALAEAERALRDQQSLLAERHPCTAQAWDRCGAQALDAKRDGDYPRAHELYRLACEGGSADACGNWGVMFEHGLGVPVDLAQARDRYDQACEGGSAHACVNLGYLHELGRGTPHDPARAAQLYDQACRADQMRGCGRLGRLVSEGATALQPPEPASVLLARACDGDYPQACLWAGQRDVEGRDGERRPERAARRFARACERAVPEACVHLGRLHELGDGVREDPGEAARLFRRACEAGEPRGCAAVERLSRDGELDHNAELTAWR